MIETDQTSFTGTLWPMHLKPQEDELLSSWLARLALAHGQTAPSFFNHVWPSRYLLTRDVDQYDDQTIFELLAQRTNTPLGRVFSTTLAAYDAGLFADRPYQSRRPWILRRHLNMRPQRCFGLQFCPWCLASDKDPYFRREWRLAFVVLCPTHRALLLDRCQDCGAAVCYERQSPKRLDTTGGWMLAQCYRCRADLRDSATDCYHIEVSAVELEFQTFLVTALRLGWAEMPQNGVIYSQLFFSGLHQIMSWLIYGRMAEPLKAALSRSYAIDLPIDYLPDKCVVLERLNVGQRRALLRAVNRLLQDWPDNFIEFCRTNKLSSHFLIGDKKRLPFWYWRVVRDHLTRGAYKVSDDEIISIANYVRNSGDQPTNEELRPFISQNVVKRARSVGIIKRKEYLGLCPQCRATNRQFKSGLSSHGTQQFRCGHCRRVYQLDYQTGRTRPRLSQFSAQHPTRQSSCIA